MLRRWLWMALAVMGIVGKIEADDYTCRRVREGQRPKMFWHTVQTKEEARRELFRYQERLWKETEEQGWEATAVGLKNAFYWLEKRGLLDCETKLEVIRRDVEFYTRHPEYLIDTYPWSLKGVECAKGFIRSELKKKGLSRMYRGWLIVQASYFWYDEFRDSLLAVAKDPSYPPVIRAYAVRAIPNQERHPQVLQTLRELLYDTAVYWIPTVIYGPYRVKELEKEGRVVYEDSIDIQIKQYVVAEAAMYKLQRMGKEAWIPESIRRKLDIFKPINPVEGGISREVVQPVSVFYDAHHTVRTGWFSEAPAWFYYWKPYILQYCPVLDEELRFTPDTMAGGDPIGGFYRWGERNIYLTPLAYVGPRHQWWFSNPSGEGVEEAQWIMQRLYYGINSVGFVCLHEFGHKVNAEQYWRGPHSPALDRDRDGLLDSLEASGYQVRGVRVAFDSALTASATFYGKRRGSDGEVYATLHGCLWPFERDWSDVDWSWGEYSWHYGDSVGASTPSNGLVKIVFPSERDDRYVVLPWEKVQGMAIVEDTSLGDSVQIQWDLWVGGELKRDTVFLPLKASV